MNQLMSEGLSARAEDKGRDQLGAGVAGNPQPISLRSVVELQIVLHNSSDVNLL